MGASGKPLSDYFARLPRQESLPVEEGFARSSGQAVSVRV
jgi:hypothetical protein